MKRRILVAAVGVLVVILCLRALIVNSEWYINGQLAKMNVTNELLKNNIRYSIRQEYKKEKLKVYIAVDNLDANIINMYKNYAPDKDFFKLEFMDKDDYKISDCIITFDEIICSEEGYCRGNKTIRLKKDMAKEVKRINPLYNTGILLKTSEIQQKINNMFNWY